MFLRNDPFFAEFDRWAQPTRRSATIAADVVRRDDHVELQFDLPGVAVDAIALTVDDGVLRLEVDRPNESSDDDQVVTRERWFGNRSRAFKLGDRLDADGLTSSFTDGVLTVAIPVRAADQPRRIEIQTEANAQLAA